MLNWYHETGKSLSELTVAKEDDTARQFPTVSRQGSAICRQTADIETLHRPDHPQSHRLYILMKQQEESVALDFFNFPNFWA